MLDNQINGTIGLIENLSHLNNKLFGSADRNLGTNLTIKVNYQPKIEDVIVEDSGCRHTNINRFTAEDDTYDTCLDCGTEWN